jgi:hypothetical protein
VKLNTKPACAADEASRAAVSTPAVESARAMVLRVRTLALHRGIEWFVISVPG